MAMRTPSADISASIARGFAWWSGELKSLLPPGLRSGGNQPMTDLVVIAQNGQLTGTVPASPGLADTQSILDDIERRSRRRPLRVRIRLPLAECLVRPVTVPRAAVPDIARIAALELERTTPLRRPDIYSAILAGDGGRGRGPVTAEYIVVKRSKIAALQARITGVGAEISGADCFRADPAVPLPVDFLNEREGLFTDRRAPTLFSGGRLAMTAAVLAFASLAIAKLRHESALLALQEETAAVRSRVLAARSQSADGDQAAWPAFARLKSSHPPIVEILEDLTRRLPDTAYVTQLRLADGTVELGGFGRPVRSLAPELEQSPFVERATITAPIVTDEKLQKERFDFRLRLAQKTPASPGSPAEEVAP
jgi:general secretion pathway protein L